MSENSRKAVITKVYSGKRMGQFKFNLIGDNGENVGNSWPESYTQKHNAIEVLEKYHPSFPIVDKSTEKRPFTGRNYAKK